MFDLIARLEASVDFPDEGYHFVDATFVVSKTEEIAGRVSDLLKDARQGRLIREGSQVVVLGKANVGKSTLFNSLLGTPRAIVNKQPGTTRDLLTETLDLNGIPITLIDTAGIRRTHDSIEEEGITRARGALNVARFVILVLDSSKQLETEDQQLLKETSSTDRLIVANKIDLPKIWTEKDLAKDHAVDIQRDCVISTSLFNKVDVIALRQKLMDRLCEGESLRDTAAVSNLRHIELLERAGDALTRAAKAGQELVPEELVLADLQGAQNALGEITGKRTPEDVLHRIFEKFCIGK